MGGWSYRVAHALSRTMVWSLQRTFVQGCKAHGVQVAIGTACVRCILCNQQQVLRGDANPIPLHCRNKSSFRRVR